MAVKAVHGSAGWLAGCAGQGVGCCSLRCSAATTAAEELQGYTLQFNAGMNKAAVAGASQRSSPNNAVLRHAVRHNNAATHCPQAAMECTLIAPTLSALPHLQCPSPSLTACSRRRPGRTLGTWGSWRTCLLLRCRLAGSLQVEGQVYQSFGLQWCWARPPTHARLLQLASGSSTATCLHTQAALQCMLPCAVATVAAGQPDVCALLAEACSTPWERGGSGQVSNEHSAAGRAEECRGQRVHAV